MKELLTNYNVSDTAIKIFREGLGKFPLTLSDIRKNNVKISIDKITQSIEELIEKKLALRVKPQHSDILPHYLFLPPFSAIIKVFSDLSNNTGDLTSKPDKSNTSINAFQDNLFQDIEEISQDLIEKISAQADNNQSTEILIEVEKNVKKFVQVMLTDVNEIISKLKTTAILNEIDINRVIRGVKEKMNESESIISNMFTQFNEIVNDMGPTNIMPQVESFKTFIRKLGESIDNRSKEIVQKPTSFPIEKIQSLEKSLYNILTDYLKVNQISTEKFWPINNLEEIKEIVSLLLKKSEKNLTIIIPTIEDFLPLTEFDLDYSEESKIKQPTKLEKPQVPKSKISIKKQKKKEIEDQITLIAKKVKNLKGFELSHDVAEILSTISEINPESVIIENLQGWLNRLLVIRKLLDQNTQYLLLEDIEKWKVEFVKIKKPEKKQPDTSSLKEEALEDKEQSNTSKGLKIKIISTEPHNDKHVQAFNTKDIEYLQRKKNKAIIIDGDNSYLVFGVSEKIKKEPYFEITGFITSFKPIIEQAQPTILKIIEEAKPPREIQINQGFNQIIENINEYSGRKIAKKLKNLLNVAFEKDGISLNILEFKLLIGKLDKIYYSLEDDMKGYVIEELKKLNKEFSTLDLEYPPEFRPPQFGEETSEDSEDEIPIEFNEIEPLDPEKVTSLFDLLLEKIDELNGVEIGEQIEKFIEVILKLQGYSQIINWKNKLRDIDSHLETPLKEKIRQDFLVWKNGIINPIMTENTSEKEKFHDSTSPQKDYLSEVEEEYKSPGMVQSQFQSDDSSSNFGNEEEKIDPKLQMKVEFENIENSFSELTGLEISKKMQNIVDIILETEGYSMALKEIKDWITKLRKNRKQLEEEEKEDFVLFFFKWKEKHLKGDSEIQTLDFGVSTSDSKDNDGMAEDEKGNSLGGKIDNLIEDMNKSTGNVLSNKLQDISDIVLRSHGAVAVNAIRQWISKLRSIRALLEDELKEEFLKELETWKEKFS